MNTKITLAATVLALAAAFTLSGCGNNTPAPSETPAVVETPEPSTTPSSTPDTDDLEGVAEVVIDVAPDGTATLPDGSVVTAPEGSTVVFVYADGSYVFDTPIEGLD